MNLSDNTQDFHHPVTLPELSRVLVFQDRGVSDDEFHIVVKFKFFQYFFQLLLVDAFYRGEAQESMVFKERFKLLIDNFWKLVNKQKQLVWLNSGYSQIAIIFPFVAAMNRYLSKE